MQPTQPPPTTTTVPVDPPTADAGPTPADILRAAASYLQRYGWMQDGYFPPTSIAYGGPTLLTKACALGAITMAVYGQPHLDPYFGPEPGRTLYRTATNLFQDWINLCTPADPDDDALTIGDWNDLPNQTRGIVIAALVDAADDWDNHHGGVR